MIENFFLDTGDMDMWCIFFKEYDSRGNLTELVSCKSESIKSKWKRATSFVSKCPALRTREVQFIRNNRHMPSLISHNGSVKFGAPIVARLPLFDFCARQGVTI